MQTSREYIASLLEEDGKQNTQTYKSLRENPEGKLMVASSIFKVNWEEFSDKELTSLSRMKLKNNSRVAFKALQAKDQRKVNTFQEEKKPEPENPGRPVVGPEPM